MYAIQSDERYVAQGSNPCVSLLNGNPHELQDIMMITGPSSQTLQAEWTGFSLAPHIHSHMLCLLVISDVS